MNDVQIIWFAVGFVSGTALITALVIILILWDLRRMRKERAKLPFTGSEVKAASDRVFKTKTLL